MKKIFYIFFGLSLLSSCTNLEETIYTDLSKENFFINEESLSKYSARVYASLQDWATEQSYWTFDIQVSDEVCVPHNPAGSWEDGGRYRQLQTHDIPNTNKLLLKAWNFCFNGISACNDVLDVFESVKKDFPGKDRVIAEVKVMRAYFYFCAICYWKDVPFAISKDLTSYPDKKDRAFVFNFIEQELKDNIDLLAVEPTIEYYGRATRAVADVLLAKLYLNSEWLTGTPRWADAEAACKDIMTANGGTSYYSLVDEYKDLFKVDNDFCREGIMVIPYNTVYTTSDNHSFIIYMSTLPSDLCVPMGINAKAWDGLCGQPDFIATYEEGDIRKSATWMFGQMYDLNGNPLTIEIDGETVPYVIDPEIPESALLGRRTALQGARIGKWEFQSDGSLVGNGDTSMDNEFYTMRYADVILMYIEAVLRQNKAADAAAITEFDKIRARAGLDPIPFSDLTLDKLYLERSHEMAVEGWHRQDMIRFGKYLNAWWNKPAMTEDDYNLPIPNDAIAANPKLK